MHSKTLIVYHVASTMAKGRYTRAQDARALVAKLNAKDPGAYAWARLARYDRQVVFLVERVNLVSGQKFVEPSNTPCHLSPASESYWSA